MRIPLRKVDVAGIGSMTEAHPSDVQGTTDYSNVTPEFAENLMRKVVDWLCLFIREFEKFEMPSFEPIRP